MRRADREFGELAGECICWLFCAPVYGNWREVLEESGAKATIIKYIGKSEYTFNIPEDIVEKEVHWYLMMADSYYSTPQKEEFFMDSGFYKYHEAYHLLKFSNEKQILERAYEEYQDLKRNHLWGSRKYY